VQLAREIHLALLETSRVRHENYTGTVEIVVTCMFSELHGYSRDFVNT
jgi:hypothetical protein